MIPTSWTRLLSRLYREVCDPAYPAGTLVEALDAGLLPGPMTVVGHTFDAGYEYTLRTRVRLADDPAVYPDDLFGKEVRFPENLVVALLPSQRDAPPRPLPDPDAVRTALTRLQPLDWKLKLMQVLACLSASGAKLDLHWQRYGLTREDAAVIEQEFDKYQAIQEARDGHATRDSRQGPVDQAVPAPLPADDCEERPPG